jgi:hypothetical protein
MKRFCLFILVATLPALLCTTAQAKTPPEADREVQYLLEFVAASGCSFERNGSSHKAEDAADHLRLKYRRGGRYVDTAEHFIDRLASESSWTGKPYTVTCEEQVIPTGKWLHEALDQHRKKTVEAISAFNTIPLVGNRLHDRLGHLAGG